MTIKIKSADVKSNMYIDSGEEINNKDPKFKVGDIIGLSKYKNIFAKDCYVLNWSEEVFVINKVKNTVVWTYVVSDLNGEEIVKIFYEKELEKTNQTEFRVGKVIKRKGDKLYDKWKGYDNSFIVILMKKDILQMSEYFPEWKSFGGKVKNELDLSNCATKADLKNAARVDISKFAKKQA